MITEKRNKIFDSKYYINDNGCWIWKGYIDKGGYGKTSFRKSKNKSSRISAHHYSYVRFKGHIPTELCVCHNCPVEDNPSCVNPEHLWVGTHLQNNRDKKNKGTQCRGEKNGTSKLTESQVYDIKERYINGEYGTDLAKEYNVSPGLIYHIKKGIVWKHSMSKEDLNKLNEIKRNYPVKLTKEKVIEIRKRYQNGERVSDLAKEFGVNTTMISRIKNRKAWTHV